MMPVEQILFATAILLLLSIVASKVTGRFGVPALILFLVVGMLAGSEGPGGIHFDDAQLAQAVGVIALVIILFAGGLDTRWESVRPTLGRALALSTAGVVLTALLVGLFASKVLGFSLLEGLLLGSIVSSTDAAAVFAVLRSKKLGLKGETKPLLELESGSNDPMAVFLTIGLTSLLLNPGASLLSLIPMFVQQMLLGGALGYVMGRAAVALVNRVGLSYPGLYPVLVLALALLIYGGTTLVGGSGFLAVYLAGVVMADRDFLHKRGVNNFFDGLAWLMQITMFLTMGLLVFPSRLVPILGTGLLVALFLMLVARPLGVFVTLLPFKMSGAAKTLVAWVGLRGSVPIILATFPLLAGLPQADMIFNIVFFIVLTSVLLQGTSLPLVARWLRLDAPVPAAAPYPLEFVPGGNLRGELREVVVPENAMVAGKQIIQAGLPRGALIALVRRGEEFVVPNGDTILSAGDRLLVLADKEELASLRSRIEKTPPPK